MNKLHYRYPLSLLQALLLVEVVQHAFNEEDECKKFLASLEAALVQTKVDLEEFRLEASFDPDRSIFIPQISLFAPGGEIKYKLLPEFFNSIDYRHLAAYIQETRGLIEPDAYVVRQQKEMPVTSIKAAYDWLMDEAKAGQQMQRYKGLGEMNPDQLWETTMDPNTSYMLQVKVEDAIAADVMFAELMGDNVESRRLFIEENALLVSNLDV